MNQRALPAEAIGTFMLISSVLDAALFSFGATEAQPAFSASR